MAAVDPVRHNRDAWDRLVEAGDEWTSPVDPEVIACARTGDWSIVLIGHQPVERSWFPDSLDGVDILCLASGGGQQAPVLAAAGANVTVFDNSDRQLAQDRFVADRDDLSLTTIQGDMRDLSALDSESFDLVFHPVSNLFCPDLEPVWGECYRVLRTGGTLLAGFMNPDIFLFDEADEQLIVRHRLPYSDQMHLSPEKLKARIERREPLEYSHTLGDQIGGQLFAGFVITAFAEAPHHAGLSAEYMSGYFATRALKA